MIVEQFWWLSGNKKSTAGVCEEFLITETSERHSLVTKECDNLIRICKYLAMNWIMLDMFKLNYTFPFH